MNVTVHKPRPPVVVGRDTTVRARCRVLDHAFGGGAPDCLPGCRDEVNEPDAFFRARGKPAADRRAPHAGGGVAQNLVAAPDGQTELAHRPSEPFEQKGVAAEIRPEQPNTAPPVGDAKRRLSRSLAVSCVPPIQSIEDLAAPGVFETDEELDQFLAFVHARRTTSLA